MGIIARSSDFLISLIPIKGLALLFTVADWGSMSHEIKKTLQQTFVLMKTSFVFFFGRRLDKDEYVRLSLTSSKDVFKTSWSYVFKMFSRRLAKMFSRRLAKTSSRRFQKVLSS